MVKNLIQTNMHGAEMILNYIHGELKQKRTRSMMMKDEFFCILSEKEWYPIEAMDYSPIIEMNRRISMQMSTPVSIRHYNSHLENNGGKQDDNVKNIKPGIGCINSYKARK